MVGESFSERLGIAQDDVPISIRYEAPAELRQLVPLVLMRSRQTDRQVNFYISNFLLAPDEGNSTPSYIRDETRRKLQSAPWFRTYELIEQLYRDLRNYAFHIEGLDADQFQATVNQFFRERGYGWQMKDGLIVARLENTEQMIVDKAVKSLADSGYATAAQELREAMADLAKLHKPDLTGAVQHASAALECAARTVAGEPGKTLGQLKAMFTPPLDSAVEKLWGFASQSGRHISEGREPTLKEAIAVVGIAATLCAALLEK